MGAEYFEHYRRLVSRLFKASTRLDGLKATQVTFKWVQFDNDVLMRRHGFRYTLVKHTISS